MPVTSPTTVEQLTTTEAAVLALLAIDTTPDAPRSGRVGGS